MTHDRFYRHNDRIEWVYHNPDSAAGGQFVYNYFSKDDLAAAMQRAETLADKFDLIGSVCRQYLADIGTPEYDAELQRIADGDPHLLAEDLTLDTWVEIVAYFGRVADMEESCDWDRYCSHCGEPMTDGYCIDGGFAYYCSSDCLFKYYTPEEYEELYKDGAAFWTQWWEG